MSIQTNAKDRMKVIGLLKTHLGDVEGQHGDEAVYGLTEAIIEYFTARHITHIESGVVVAGFVPVCSCGWSGGSSRYKWQASKERNLHLKYSNTSKPYSSSDYDDNVDEDVEQVFAIQPTVAPNIGLDIDVDTDDISVVVPQKMEPVAPTITTIASVVPPIRLVSPTTSETPIFDSVKTGAIPTQSAVSLEKVETSADILDGIRAIAFPDENPTTTITILEEDYQDL